MNEVVCFKLMGSGDEIMGRLVTSDDNTVTMEKVRVVMIQPMGGDRLGVGFMPYIASNFDTTIKLSKLAIAAEVKPSKELVDGYLQSTTGLALVS